MQCRAALEELLQYIRILILDDDEKIGQSIVSNLQKVGYSYVEHTADPDEAWSKLSSTNILLIDHDLADSEINGTEFTQQAKAKYQDHLDVIIYSGSAEKLTDYAKQAGATACLEKPLKFEYLELWIKETAKRIWYEKILNAIPDEVIVIDPTDEEFGKIHYANKVKKDRYETQGKPLEYDYCWKRFELRGTGDRPCIGCIPREAFEQKSTMRNYWNYRTWDGKKESVDIHAAPIYDQIGNIRCIIETCRDRTQQEKINKSLRRIESENDWAKRLNIFLNGFIDIGYNRIRFYKVEEQNTKFIFHGIYQVGMPDDFNIHAYSYDSENDPPTRIITQSQYPTLFLVKFKGDYEWKMSSSNPNVYRVSHKYVANNHVLEKHRWLDIPLIADRKVIAKVSVEPEDTGRFISSHDLELLSYYADWAGQALWNAEQREKLHLKDETNQLIIQMNHKISKVPIHNRWLPLVVKRVSQALNTSSCCLFLLEGEKKRAKLVKAASSVSYTHLTLPTN